MWRRDYDEATGRVNFVQRRITSLSMQFLTTIPLIGGYDNDVVNTLTIWDAGGYSGLLIGFLLTRVITTKLLSRKTWQRPS